MHLHMSNCKFLYVAPVMQLYMDILMLHFIENQGVWKEMLIWLQKRNQGGEKSLKLIPNIILPMTGSVIK